MGAVNPNTELVELSELAAYFSHLFEIENMIYSRQICNDRLIWSVQFQYKFETVSLTIRNSKAAYCSL